MTVQAHTVLIYTGALFALIGLLFLTVWINGGRRNGLHWFALPLGSGTCGAILFAKPGLFPELLSLQIGAWFSLLAYGLVWQAMRALYERRARIELICLPPTGWLLLSIYVFGPYHLLEISAATRSLVLIFFQAMTAREFWTARWERLPARQALFWIFAGYSLYTVIKLCLVAYLPMPLGGLPTTVWAVVVDNTAVVMLVLLTGAFVICLLHERVTLSHYRLARRDPLTGIGNLRAFEEQEAALRSLRDTERITLAVFDIDHFKSVNDNFGHDLGDQVIKLAAETASEIVGSHESVFRVGGEEFVCLLSGLDADASYLLAERIRMTFRARATKVGSCEVNATLSIGIAEAARPGESLSIILRKADDALYRAKSGGRDRSVVAAQVSDETASTWPPGSGRS